MKVYLVGDGESVSMVFSNEAAAKEFAGGGMEVEEREVHDAAPAPVMFYERIADVYPDGFVKRYYRQYETVGEEPPPDCDDHLRTGLPGPWDGHTQGHCGEHVYVSGTDRQAVNAAFNRWIKEAVVRQNGKCQSKNHTHGDGVTVFETGWWGETRRSNLAGEQADTGLAAPLC